MRRKNAGELTFAQRRPEGCSGYNSRSSASQDRSQPHTTLNEGRRGAPATTAGSARRSPSLCALNEGRRGAPATTPLNIRPSNENLTLNEGRRGAPATTIPARRPHPARHTRSTKAGGVLRLQLDASMMRAISRGCAQRRPEGCSGYNPRSPRRKECPTATLNEGRRGAPATTPSDAHRRSARAALNEGRRGAPATTREGTPRRRILARRSTKAGGVLRLQPVRSAARDGTCAPSLNEGRRGAPATTTTPPAKGVSSKLAQRRPEGCSGYNSAAAAASRSGR